jgi:hypothetical protein
VRCTELVILGVAVGMRIAKESISLANGQERVRWRDNKHIRTVNFGEYAPSGNSVLKFRSGTVLSVAPTIEEAR